MIASYLLPVSDQLTDPNRLFFPFETLQLSLVPSLALPPSQHGLLDTSLPSTLLSQANFRWDILSDGKRDLSNGAVEIPNNLAQQILVNILPVNSASTTPQLVQIQPLLSFNKATQCICI